MIADAHWFETRNAIEHYAELVRAFGHRLIEQTDAQVAEGGYGDEDVRAVPAVLEVANGRIADYLREHTAKLLDSVLYTSSNLMHNSFAMSDRWV